MVLALQQHSSWQHRHNHRPQSAARTAPAERQPGRELWHRTLIILQLLQHLGRAESCRVPGWQSKLACWTGRMMRAFRAGCSIVHAPAGARCQHWWLAILKVVAACKALALMNRLMCNAVAFLA